MDLGGIWLGDVEAEAKMTEKKTRISLRFWHPTWKAAVFSDTLNLRPRFIHSVGEPRATPVGKRLEGTYAKTYWCYDHEAGNDCDPADAIKGLLTTISPHVDFVRSAIESGGEAEILVCIISPADFGESFPSEVLLDLGRLGIGLSFDLYFGDPEKP